MDSSPPRFQFPLCFFLLLSVVIIPVTSRVEGVSPLVTVPGDVEVVMLIDVQNGPIGDDSWSGDDQNEPISEDSWPRDGRQGPIGNDTESRDSAGVLPLVLGAVSMVQRLQRDNVSFGLTVYDTSGPTSGAIRLLAAMIVQEETTPAAVLTVTSSSLTSSVSALLRPFSVPHVIISPDQLSEGTQPDTRHLLSFASRARVQSAIKLLDVLHMRYATILTSNNRIAQSEADLFRQLARQTSTLCVFPSRAADTSATTLVFTGDDDNIVDGDDVSPAGSVVVVVGDGVGHVMWDVARQTLLWLQEDVTTLGDLDLLLSVDPPVTLPSLNTSSCEHFHILTDTPTPDQTTPPGHTQSCLVTMETVRQILAVRDALGIIATEASQGNKTSISNKTSLSNRTSLSNKTVAGNDIDVASGERNFLLQDEMSVTERTRVFRVRVYGKRLEGEYNSSTAYSLPSASATLHVPSALLLHDVSSQCDLNCHLCGVCTPKMTSEEKAMVSPALADSTLVIVGMFPVHTSSSTRDDCSLTHGDCTVPDTGVHADCTVPNPVGLAAARAFMVAIENHKNRTPGRSTRGLTVGGVVVDSCGQSDAARSVESCLYSFTNSTGGHVVIQPSTVAAYVTYSASPLHHDVTYNPAPIHYDVSKLGVAITDTAYSLGAGSRRTELIHIGRVLAAIKWTYVKVVVSHRDSLVTELRDTFTSVGVCVELQPVGGLVTMATVAKRLTSTSFGVVFLTDVTDTRRVLEAVTSLNASARVKYFLAAGNWRLADTQVVRQTAELVVTALPTLPRATNFHAQTEEDNPWAVEFSSVAGKTVELNQGQTQHSSDSDLRMEDRVREVVSQAVSTLLSELDAAYKDLCPQQHGLCRAMADLSALRDHVMTRQGQGVGVDILTLRPQRGYTLTQVGEMSPDGKVTLSNMATEIPTSSCPGWCPRCLTCPAYTKPTATATDEGANASDMDVSPLRPAVYIPGDILVAAILPMRSPGPRSFRCGELRGDGEEERAEQAFLFAVETAQRRYANLLNGVTVGGVLLDSCSHLPTALHTLGEFESCHMGGGVGDQVLEDGTATRSFPPSPQQVVGYVIQENYPSVDVIRGTVLGLGKMAAVSAVPRMSECGVRGGASECVSRLTVEAIQDLFSIFGWRHVHVVTSSRELYVDMAEYLVQGLGSRDVCVVSYTQLLPSGRDVGKMVAGFANTHVPVVAFLPRAEAVLLFRDGEVGRVARPWVLSVTGDDWLSTVGVNVPWGALLVDGQGKVSEDFQLFLEQFSAIGTPPLTPWWQSYLALRHGCRSGGATRGGSGTPALRMCEENPLMGSTRYPSATAARVIRAVDSILHAVNARYRVACPHGNGICSDLAKDILKGTLTLSEARFTYEGGRVGFTADGHMETTLSVFSYQPGEIVLAGTYGPSGLSVNTSRVLFFTPSGQPVTTPPPSSSAPLSDSAPFSCPLCTCINLVSNASRSRLAPPPGLPREVWWEERGVFVREAWTWGVLAVALGGACLALFVIFYVLYKVWQGALARRYIGLGLVLLLSIILLFLSALPFLFSPSPSVCGLRYLYPPVAQCLVMACMLVKLMALQDYRRIGLGGELSACNQGLSLLFVLLVQVSVSALWWVFKGPFLLTDLDPRDGKLKAACEFERRDFVASQSFVLFLVALCAVYSVGVRKEKKNMGEARLLLACCWTLVLLWLGWTPTLLLLTDLYAPVVCCGGILASAWVVLLVVFVPKVRLVSRLKYDLSRKHGGRNGYSIDTDFLYERPYSLPGTLTSTYSSIRTYPKSLTANFDSSLSY